jgi:hypothetical protein
MVIDELAEEGFVCTDWLDLSQPELDRRSRAESYAIPLTFAGGIRIAGCHNRPIGLGIIRPTRGC